MEFSKFTSGIANANYDANFVYAVGKEVYVKGGFDSAKLFDLTGKELSQSNDWGYLTAPAAGIYIVKAVKDANILTAKVIVK